MWRAVATIAVFCAIPAGALGSSIEKLPLSHLPVAKVSFDRMSATRRWDTDDAILRELIARVQEAGVTVSEDAPVDLHFRVTETPVPGCPNIVLLTFEAKVYEPTHLPRFGNVEYVTETTGAESSDFVRAADVESESKRLLLFYANLWLIDEIAYHREIETRSCDPEAVARYHIAAVTCYEPFDATDESECAADGAAIWLESFQPLRPERWTGTRMYLYRRAGKWGWISVDARCRTDRAGRLNLEEKPQTDFREVVLLDYASTPPVAKARRLDEADAIWRVSEFLRAEFSPLVKETGRPLGRAFFPASGELDCAVGQAREEASARQSDQEGQRPRKVTGAPPRAVRVDRRWTVSLEEWRCDENARYRWEFIIPDTDLGNSAQLRVREVGAAPSCGCP